MILAEKGLNVSFSKVKYREMAPRVGLDPYGSGSDMQTFDIRRARIPTSLFKDIVQDLEISMKQYGEPNEQANEEARSRCLAPVSMATSAFAYFLCSRSCQIFGRLVGLFDLTIHNTPKSVIPAHMTTRGRIEYHYVVLGGISLLVIEVKYTMGNAQERLNAIAQVIAELDGMQTLPLLSARIYISFIACDYANDHRNFPPTTVYGVLCDGTIFEFFSFNGETNPPTVSRGVFPTPTLPVPLLSIANYYASRANFILSLRPICETIFYLLLLSYKTAIQASTTRSTGRAKKQKSPRASTPSWQEALLFAEEALQLAVDAAAKATTGDSTTANEVTERTLENLRKRFRSQCFHLAL